MRRALIAAGAALALVVTTAIPAAATPAPYSWDTTGDGNVGNFDLDLTVNNGLPLYTGLNGTFGTHSATNDVSGWFEVNTRLGVVLTTSSPTYVHDFGALNQATVLDDADSPWGMDGRWVHETPTVVYNPVTEQWHSFWHTFPKSHPFTSSPSDPWRIIPTGGCDVNTAEPHGKNFTSYGWIGGKTWDNTVNAFPDPDMGTVPADETVLFLGNVWGQDQEDLLATTDFTTGSGIEDFIPGDPYQAYSEPGAIVGPDGTVYLAMTGYWCDGDDVYGDVVLMAMDIYGTWTYVDTVLTATFAQAAGDYLSQDWAYFTASSLHYHDGDIHLMVTPVGANGSSYPGMYLGVIEFEFDDIETGALVVDGYGSPIVVDAELAGTGQFAGAGTFNPSTAEHAMARYCGMTNLITPGCSDSTPFEVWSVDW